ncbi:uncharacterized protein LOC126740113 [Anthonomus grandis grandis]|uniref:uncharacterized protein LOC126740113 n=1 Tax=Anthonomus grandis grandis TaxID=2921223 RepID=UPI002165A22D|nr:uncharacterized protein LOC126740113 [Anthonomus grandis grandis]
MEDTKALVMIFLQKVLHDRQHLIDATYKLIYEYNNGERKQVDYEATLKQICSLLGKEIPNQVLVYLLTLVDMPLDLSEETSPVIEKMKTLEEFQKSQNSLTESIKPHLKDCGIKPEIKQETLSEDCLQETKKHEDDKPTVKRHYKRKVQGKLVEESDEDFVLEDDKPKRPYKRKAPEEESAMDNNKIIKENNRKGKQKKVKEPLPLKAPVVTSLLDLTAMAVLKNFSKIKKNCQKKFDKAWGLVNSNRLTEFNLQRCYAIIRDLNKKRWLLREIENDNITFELMEELYQDTDIILREKHVYHELNRDIFEDVRKALGFEEK